MTGFLIKRVLQAVFVIVAVTLLVSYAVRLTGDPALMLSQGSGSVTEQDLANIRQALGLNRPFHEQYLSYMQGLLHGDFGRSFMGGTPVAKLIGDALPATLMLAFTSLIASILISLPLGIQAAIKRGKPTDQAIRILSLVGLSFPNFWLALMLVLLLSITFPLLPPSGWSGPASLVLPSLTMAIILSATNIRLVRTTMLETLSAQYIMVARSKGLKERIVLYKHALRNGVLPVVTMLGLQFGNVLAGAILVETVFNWPGLGRLAFDSVLRRDYPTLLGILLFASLLVVVMNQLTDLAYRLIDPRIKTS